eukprot:674948_1
MALIGVASAASATIEGVEVETDRIADVSFSEQVEGAMGLTQMGDEGTQEEKASNTKGSDKPAAGSKESKDISSSDDNPKGKRKGSPISGSVSRSRSRKYPSIDEWFAEGICDPDNTGEEDLDLCEDIWETICNPDDEVSVADELCDWLGFTTDVVWYEGEDFDYELEYVRIAPEEKKESGEIGSSDSKSKSKYGSMKNSRNDRFVEAMCDPDKSKPGDEGICNEVWDSLCNPDEETEADDDFCDWIGFTADVEWDYSDYDYFEDENDLSDSYDENDSSDSSDSYGSEDRARKNLRG